MALKYADEIMVLLAHADPVKLAEAARLEAQVDRDSLGDLKLTSNDGKSDSLVLSPFNFAGGLFHRPEVEQRLGNFKRNENLAAIRGRMGKVPVNGGGGWSGTELEEIFRQLPYKVSAGIKVLGMRLDNGLTFVGQLQQMLTKARSRLAILTKVQNGTNECIPPTFGDCRKL